MVGNEGAIANKYLFAGEQFDSSLGDYYLRDRFYDAKSGRFLRRDIYQGRQSNPLTLHKYSYIHNNPINGTDPTGLFTMGEFAAANSIRNILAGIQADTGAYLINATLKGGNYGAADFFQDFAMNAAFVAVGFAAAYLSSSVPKTPISIPRGARIVGDSAASFGQGFGILTGRTVKVSKKGLEIVEMHLKRFGADGPNSMMLQRLQAAHKAGKPISDADAIFYTHEIAEAGFMARGMEYPEAHAAALAKYDVDPRAVYAPEIIQAFPGQFNNYWRIFWGLK